jgi:hypothetical protein
MPIRVSCECGKQLQAPDAAAGKKVRCPGCLAAVAVPAQAPAPPKPAAGAPARPPKSPPVEDDDREPEPETDKEAGDPAPRKPPKKPSRAALDLDDEDPEEAPKKARKPSRRSADADAEDSGEKPRKKRPLWVILLGVGCGGFLLLTCSGVGLLGGFLFYLNSQQDTVAGKWVVDPDATANASLSPLHRSTQLEFDKKDMRCTMQALGIEFSGKWRIVRNRENDAILVLVDFEEARGPGGKKLDMQGREKFQAAFEVTPVDATHIDLVDVKDYRTKL